MQRWLSKHKIGCLILGGRANLFLLFVRLVILVNEYEALTFQY